MHYNTFYHLMVHELIYEQTHYLMQHYVVYHVTIAIVQQKVLNYVKATNLIHNKHYYLIQLFLIQDVQVLYTVLVFLLFPV